MRRTYGVKIALLVAALSAASDAQAASQVMLTWTAPSDCPSQADVLAQIDALTPATTEPARPLLVDAQIEARETGGLTLQLSVGGAERRLDAATCAELAEATAVIVAIALHPDAPPSPPSSVAPAPARDLPSDHEETSVRVALRGFGLFDVAALPSPSPGLGAALGLRWPNLRVEGFFAMFAEQSATVDNPAGAGAEVGLALGGLRGCLGLGAPTVEVEACGSFELGNLSASAFGVDAPRQGSALWLAPGLELDVGYPLSASVGLFGSMGLLTPLGREHFDLREIGAIYQPPKVSARGALGIEVRLP